MHYRNTFRLNSVLLVTFDQYLLPHFGLFDKQNLPRKSNARHLLPNFLLQKKTVCCLATDWPPNIILPAEIHSRSQVFCVLRVPKALGNQFFSPILVTAGVLSRKKSADSVV